MKPIVPTANVLVEIDFDEMGTKINPLGIWD